MNALLRAHGLPPVNQDLAVNPYPGRLRVIWNPLAGIEHGANPAGRYYPGDGCVDMIGNDMFSSAPGGGSFEENQALYDAHPKKPYSLPEWGLQGVDDQPFKTHRRTQMAAYYESKPGSIYDLGDKRRAAWRTARASRSWARRRPPDPLAACDRRLDTGLAQRRLGRGQPCKRHAER